MSVMSMLLESCHLCFGCFFILSVVSLHLSLSRGMDVTPGSLKHNCFKQGASCCYSDLLQQHVTEATVTYLGSVLFQISTKEDATWQRNQRVIKKE